MNRTVRATATALALFTAQFALAQPGAPPAPDPANLRGDSVQTRKRLAEAEQKLTSGKAADAADDLQRLLDESADDLVTLDGREYRSARWVVHALLVKLPPDVLKAYRDRIDPPAQKLLDEARRTRDPHPLWLLLDRYFVSRPADEALRLLGDLLFERGEFRAAEGVWQRLLPDGGADVAYPGSKADQALVRARIALAVVFQADLTRARAEVAAFKAKHPAATGSLAGKTGPLAETLEAYLTAPPQLPPDATSGTAWPTYGGGPDRAGRVPNGLPTFAHAARPSWTGDLEDQNFNRPGSSFPPARPPFGHPIILGDEVFVADGSRVLGFDLRTGLKTRRWTTPLKAPNGVDSVCTLTAADGRLYVRSGPATVRGVSADEEKPAARSALVCLDLKPGKQLKELWSIAPPEDSKVATAWEGAPLVSGRRLWAVYARFEGGRTVHVAVCYDPADATQPPGRPVWRTELCDNPLPVSGGERTRQELLTLAGRHVVFCSNTGAVVALDAVTGRRAWGFRYPRSLKAANSGTGDPAPAVASDGHVFVAPADGGHVCALDAETGRVAWQSGPTDGARILGVARGRLIVTVAGPVRSVRGLSLANGSYRDGDGGWIQLDAPLSYGQGLVTDDAIVWPSREGLYFLNPETGAPRSGGPVTNLGPSSTRTYFGNLVYADGVLVVVTPTEVRGYLAEAQKVVPRPDTPRERFDALIGRAERAVAAGQPAQARAVLAEAVTSDLPASLRAWAAARMLQLCPTGTEPTQLPAEVRAALRPPLLTEWVISPDGVPVTLEAFVAHHSGKPPPATTPVRAADGTKPCAPDLGADAGIDHVLKLPHAVSPLRLIAGAAGAPKHLFAAGPRVVIAVPLDRSAAREYEPADGFTHAADLSAGFVAAGPLAVAVYGAAREPLWVFRVPTTARLPTGTASAHPVSADEPPAPHLSSFALAGSWLIARIGEHHLVALDLVAQRVAWVLGASGRAGYEPAQFPGAVRFGPHFALSGTLAVVQRSDGRRWFVRLDSGRPVTLPALGGLTARAWWASPPACAGPNRLLLSDGPGLVRLVPLDGRVKWAYEVDRDDGLSGEPPQARAWGDVLLVAVRRNTGIEIERLNPVDGKRVWSDEPAFADADRTDLRAADTDADRVYVPAANKLLALALGTGKTVWEADLPDDRGTGWVVRAGKTCVIAYPAEALTAESPGVVWARLVRSFRAEPYVWRLPGLAATLYDAWVVRAVPVVLFDPESGKKLARIDIPARGPAVAAWFDADTAVVATGDRVVWLK